MKEMFMQRFLSTFRFIAVFFLVLCYFLSCDDLPRDNLLDPKNPNSYRDHMVSIEAFVNTNNDTLFNEYMLSALATIEERYPGEVNIAHYHRDTRDYEDSLAILPNPESEFLYESYINLFDSQKGVPDVFINGSTERIKGASSVASALERIEDAIQPLLIMNSLFTIEPVVSRQGDRISFSARIARLGSKPINNILLRAVLVERVDNELYRSVVRHIEASNLIPNLGAGEQKEVEFSAFNYNTTSELSIIFTIVENETMIIHQSIEVSIP
jgi:hypothetical protein